MESGESLIPQEVVDLLFSSISSIIMPVIIVSLVGALIWGIIKVIIGQAVFSFSRISGSTYRQAKKNKNRVTDAIDLISTTNDLHNATKK